MYGNTRKQQFISVDLALLILLEATTLIAGNSGIFPNPGSSDIRNLCIAICPLFVNFRKYDKESSVKQTSFSSCLAVLVLLI